MSESSYRDPSLTLSKIYTRGGDEGSTNLVNGRRVAKDDPRVEAYGLVDELNARVGCARTTAIALSAEHPRVGELATILLRVQHELFNLGSLLATDAAEVGERQPRVTEADVSKLEQEIDAMSADLPALKSFTLPGGCRLEAELHLCRTACRTAERRAVALSRGEDVSTDALTYLNRLSDAFFVWSRWACAALGVQETLWQPNRASSGGE